ncbi:MAG: hypothetical protein ACRC37_06540, partial [Lentisphaeria bacterium]
AGEQDFKAEETQLNPEVAKLAELSLNGSVASATIIETTNTAVATAVNELGESVDIKDTAHLSEKETQHIQKLVLQAEEDKLIQTAKIELADMLVKYGKLEALQEKVIADFARFVVVCDDLLEKLSVSDIEAFLKSENADFYRDIVAKYKK